VCARGRTLSTYAGMRATVTIECPWCGTAVEVATGEAPATGREPMRHRAAIAPLDRTREVRVIVSIRVEHEL